MKTLDYEDVQVCPRNLPISSKSMQDCRPCIMGQAHASSAVSDSSRLSAFDRVLQRCNQFPCSAAMLAKWRGQPLGS